MKMEAPQTNARNYGQLFANLLAEPFLAIGIALFWATALPVAALLFAAVTAVEQVRGYVFAPATAAALLTRRAA